MKFKSVFHIFYALVFFIIPATNINAQENIGMSTGNYGGITTSAEVEGYKAAIAQYEKEVEYLKKQNSDLLAAITGKNQG